MYNLCNESMFEAIQGHNRNQGESLIGLGSVLRHCSLRQVKLGKRFIACMRNNVSEYC